MGWRYRLRQRGSSSGGPGSDHSPFLTHDDMIDRSELRRGRPAFYRHFAEHHATHGWHGPTDAYGDATALNL
ncbi:polyprenyl synthetase family protein [Streptomyces sp. NBC_00237]|uniref:polyprenyl synthetase family protein n=1 Tax=Streptomyces sp. NBC_00237 TaxID=2975687 RepID=UPI00224DA3FA|nr:polyprenyl synthetase family protein [Streptomyces sp. NBC_00237]MCX5205945.1 polyprenyl synthetase family protein [Streptomyces sp. NBC_00237]